MTSQSKSNPLFQEELRELLTELDAAILDLDQDQSPGEAVNRVFRALHTIKGSCDMFGLHGAVAMLHGVEDLWDRVRMGLMPPSKELLDLTFAVKDHLDPVVETGQDIEPDEPFLATLASLAEAPATPGEPMAPPQEQPDGQAAQDPEPAAKRTFRIRFSLSDQGALRRLDPEPLLEGLRELGDTVVAVDASKVPPLEDLDPADCFLGWDVLLTTDKDPDSIRDVFLFLENPADASVEEVSPRALQAQAPVQTPVQAPAQAMAPAEPKVQRSAPAQQPPVQTAQAAPAPKASPAEAAPAKPLKAPAAKTTQTATQTASQPAQAKPKEPAQSLRVEAAKLDNLVNLVGELVIAQARLAQVASGIVHSELTGVAEEIERLVGELRDNTLGIRMLPIGTTFSRFRRLVRDLSTELGKEIELVAEGGETELDKTVIEQLGDPLVHLLRNSIDHGIEPPDDRVAAGKPGRGVIVLSAKQAGGSVIIRISDDGKGLATERIRAKAVERGVIAPDAKLSDQEIFQLIFAPGFSTAEKVTSVSGRGVGMDVVKRSIESLRGVIEIDSETGKGTVITIALPLTLAIIDGLEVRTAGEFYIIPLAMVEECVELTQAEREARSRGRTLNVRGDIVPYLRLRETFLLAGEAPDVEQVVITRHENGRTGIAVDEVIGQQQTVIKSLGRLLGRVEGISGATINGDGSMALILDVPHLVGCVQRQSDESWGRQSPRGGDV